MKKIRIKVAGTEHLGYVPEIKKAIISASKIKGTGLAKRSAEYITKKIIEGKAIIAIFDNKKFAGFCYIESWGHKRFVANSGLIVPDEFRGMGLAKNIKREAFKLSRVLFPAAKLFGLTTNLAVMKINSALGYKPVTFSELTDDDEFWKGCQTCAYYDILFRTNRVHCLCTAMLCDPEKTRKNGKKIHKIKGQLIEYFGKEKKNKIDV